MKAVWSTFRDELVKQAYTRQETREKLFTTKAAAESRSRAAAFADGQGGAASLPAPFVGSWAKDHARRPDAEASPSAPTSRTSSAFLRRHAAPLPAEDVELLRLRRARARRGRARARWTSPASRARRWTATRCAARTPSAPRDYEPVELAWSATRCPVAPSRAACGGRGRAHHDRRAAARGRRRGGDGRGLRGTRGPRARCSEPVAPRKHVGAIGEDVRRGEVVLRAGGACGRRTRACSPRSAWRGRAACGARAWTLVITGDELLPAGSAPERRRIVDTNSVDARGARRARRRRAAALRAAARPAGADPRGPRGRARGRRARVGRDLGRPARITRRAWSPSSGASTSTASRCGRRARPASAASAARCVFLLPGNPVSCLCAYEFFAGPTIRALGGRSRAWPHRRARCRSRARSSRPSAAPTTCASRSRTARVDADRDRGRVDPVVDGARRRAA